MTSLAEIYQRDLYPPMSHPSAGLAGVRRAACRYGLQVSGGESPRILEIGCGQGHHLLSLSEKYPEGEMLGLDISEESINRARRRASSAGLKNCKFEQISVEDFTPEGSYDLIIAHGVFSWIPDTEKLALLDRIGKWLAANGAGVIDFNVAAGWKARMKVVEKVRAIQSAAEIDEIEALQVLRNASDVSEKKIIDDMLAKGPEVLAFDDFAPVMDAWSLGAFLKLAEASHLQWLGDSVTGERGTDGGDEANFKTHRSELFCRADVSLGSPSGLEQIAVPVYKMPDQPKLSPWKMTCVREALPVPDRDLVPCQFTFPQLKILAAMDGTRNLPELAEYGEKIIPQLNFVEWMRHIAERGIVD